MLEGYCHSLIEIPLGLNEKTECVFVKQVGKSDQIKILTFAKDSGELFFRFRSSKPGYFQYYFGDQKGSFRIILKKNGGHFFNYSRIKLDKKGKLIDERNRPFFWLADTWWYGSTKRALWPSTFKKLVLDRKKKGFSVVLLSIGIPPEIPIYSRESENSGGIPILKTGEVNLNYFKEVDKKIALLASNGIVTCIVGGWGYHMDYLGYKTTKNLWREIIARYSAYPVVFCLCGEADGDFNNGASSSYSLSKTLLKRLLPGKTLFRLNEIKEKTVGVKRGFSHTLSSRLSSWNKIGRFIKKSDSFNNLLTAHVSGIVPPSKLFNHPKWLDIDSVQTGHTESTRFELANKIISNDSGLPVINLEPWYENILGNFGAYHQRYSFWLSLLSGSCGYTYGANGIWQMGKAGSKFLSHWGNANWKVALNYRGSMQISKAKQFLEKLEWWKIKAVKIIYPHFNKNNLDLPLAAKIGKNNYLIYFPKFNKAKHYRIVGLNLGHFVKSWINCKNLRPLKSVKIVNSEIFPLNYESDRLLLLSKK